VVPANASDVIPGKEKSMSKADTLKKVSEGKIRRSDYVNILSTTRDKLDYAVCKSIRAVLKRYEPKVQKQDLITKGLLVVERGSQARYFEYPASPTWKEQIKDLMNEASSPYIG
jgi:hypothetical protein